MPRHDDGQATLVVGYTGSGKTFRAIREGLRHGGCKFVVNNSIEEFETIEHDDLDRVPRNSFVILDDEINPTESESRMIYTLFQKLKRHKNLTVFYLCHTLLSTGAFKYLSCVDRVIVTRHTNNRRSFMNICTALKVDREEAVSVWKKFVNGEEKFAYLELNCASLEWKTTVLHNDDDEGERKEILKNRMSSILLARGNCELGLKLFDFLLDNFDIGEIRASDMSLVMFTPESKEVRVSVVDLLYYCTNDEDNEEPPEETISLMRELSREFVIPAMFVRNPKFRKALD